MYTTVLVLVLLCNQALCTIDRSADEDDHAVRSCRAGRFGAVLDKSHDCLRISNIDPAAVLARDDAAEFFRGCDNVRTLQLEFAGKDIPCSFFYKTRASAISNVKVVKIVNFGALSTGAIRKEMAHVPMTLSFLDFERIEPKSIAMIDKKHQTFEFLPHSDPIRVSVVLAGAFHIENGSPWPNQIEFPWRAQVLRKVSDGDGSVKFTWNGLEDEKSVFLRVFSSIQKYVAELKKTESDLLNVGFKTDGFGMSQIIKLETQIEELQLQSKSDLTELTIAHGNELKQAAERIAELQKEIGDLKLNITKLLAQSERTGEADLLEFQSLRESVTNVADDAGDQQTLKMQALHQDIASLTTTMSKQTDENSALVNELTDHEKTIRRLKEGNQHLLAEIRACRSELQNTHFQATSSDLVDNVQAPHSSGESIAEDAVTVMRSKQQLNAAQSFAEEPETERNLRANKSTPLKISDNEESLLSSACSFEEVRPCSTAEMTINRPQSELISHFRRVPDHSHQKSTAQIHKEPLTDPSTDTRLSTKFSFLSRIRRASARIKASLPATLGVLGAGILALHSKKRAGYLNNLDLSSAEIIDDRAAITENLYENVISSEQKSNYPWKIVSSGIFAASAFMLSWMTMCSPKPDNAIHSSHADVHRTSAMKFAAAIAAVSLLFLGLPALLLHVLR